MALVVSPLFFPTNLPKKKRKKRQHTTCLLVVEKGKKQLPTWPGGGLVRWAPRVRTSHFVFRQQQRHRSKGGGGKNQQLRLSLHLSGDEGCLFRDLSRRLLVAGEKKEHDTSFSPISFFFIVAVVFVVVDILLRDRPCAPTKKKKKLKRENSFFCSLGCFVRRRPRLCICSLLLCVRTMPTRAFSSPVLLTQQASTRTKEKRRETQEPLFVARAALCGSALSLLPVAVCSFFFFILFYFILFFLFASCAHPFFDPRQEKKRSMASCTTAREQCKTTASKYTS